MTNRYLLDTNAIVEMLRGNHRIIEQMILLTC